MTLARFDTWIRSAVGPAAAGASVFICSQPATVSSNPTPKAQLYSDVAGTLPIAQPLIADGFGHVYCYIASGTYTIVVVYGGSLVLSYPDQIISGLSGSGSGGSITIATAVASFLTAAAGDVLTSDGLGNVQDGGVLLSSLATNAALALKAPLNSPAFIGLPTTPEITFLGSGSGSVSIVSPAAPSTWTLTLPTSAGVANQYLSTNGAGVASWATLPPSGLVIGSVQWLPGLAGGTPNLYPVSDTIQSASDSGATMVYNNPTSTTNRAVAMTGTRNYIGSMIAYGGRNFTFTSVATFARGADTFSVAAVGMFADLTWDGFPFTITTTACACFHITAGATTWYALTGDGASVTDVDTHVDFTNRNALEIDYTPTSVVFKANGSVVATSTTNIPSTSALAMAIASNRGLGGSTPLFTIEYLNCSNTTV